MNRSLTIATVVGLAAGAASAGNVVASWGFTELSASYDSAAGIFRAEAANTDDLGTSGDVTRLAGDETVKGTADYDAGFFGASLANVVLEINVSNIAGGVADGSGSIEITDVDGDILRADFEGTWNEGAFGFVFFSGTGASGASFDATNGDGIFEGPSGGSFDIADLTSVFDDAVSVLLRMPGDFFTGDFENVSLQADGLIVPTPASMLLTTMGIAAVATPRRRR